MQKWDFAPSAEVVGLVRRMVAALLVWVVWLSTPSAAMAASMTWSLPLSDLGVEEPVVLAGPLAERTVTVPVPTGLHPQSLLGRFRAGPGALGGWLEVRDGRRTLAWVPLRPGEGSLSVPLGEARVVAGRLPLTWRLILSPERAVCAAPLIDRAELEGLTVELKGRPLSPRTVADFWPPDLRALKLVLPGEPTLEEATAALQLVAFGARQALGHPLTVTVAIGENDLPAPPDPWTRWIRLGRGEARIALRSVAPEGFPTLEIQAPAGALESAVETVLAYREALRSPAVRPLAVSPSESPSGERLPIAALGFPQIQMTGSGPMQARIFFSQGDLGGPVRRVRWRLVGRLSPVPEGGAATLLVYLNGGLVYSEPMAGGSLDREIALPDGLLRRDNTLLVRVDYTPPGGDCRVGVHPLTVFIDGASTLSFRRAQGLPPSFERFPQSLLPVFTVGLQPLNASTLNAAADLIAALQRLTRTPLRPQVRPWAEASQVSGPLLLVTEDPEAVAALRPPLDPRPFRVLDLEGRERLRMDPGRSFAVLEGFTHQGRDVLLLTRYGARPDLGRIAEAMDPELGWYALNGDVWLWPDGEPPVALRIRDSALRVVLEPPGPASFWARALPWLVGLAFAGVLAFLVWAYPRLVRSRPPGEEPPP